MTERELILMRDTRDVKTLTKAEALEQLEVYRKYKMWGSSRYYSLNSRVQELACREWVHADVFGNTFSA